MPTEPAPLTLSDAVRRAIDACDSTGAGDGLTHFEDRDEPIASLADADGELTEAFGAVDPQEEDPELQMVRAVATYLAFRRDEAADSDENLLRLAARSEWTVTRPITSVTGSTSVASSHDRHPGAATMGRAARRRPTGL